MVTADDVTRAWVEVQARLPDGWNLDGLRCASTGLAVDARSEEWIAVAAGPDGQERRHQAPDAVQALEGLADALAGTDPPRGTLGR